MGGSWLAFQFELDVWGAVNAAVPAFELGAGADDLEQWPGVLAARERYERRLTRRFGAAAVARHGRLLGAAMDETISRTILAKRVSFRGAMKRPPSSGMRYLG